MSNLFAEMKRRNVVRVAIAYVVFAWVVMQVIDVVVEPLRLPDWTATLMLVILLVGLPLALFLSWAYEITPDGVKKTHEVDMDDSITPSTGRKLDRMIMGVMAIAIALLVYDPVTDRTALLNLTAAGALELCDGAHTVSQIKRELEDAFSCEAQELGTATEDVLRSLYREGFFDPDPSGS